MKYCKKCGTQMEDSADFCPQCGTKASAPKNGNHANAQTANAASKTEPPKQEQTAPRQADNSPWETRSYEPKTAGYQNTVNSIPPAEKKKLPLPALIAIIGGAAAAVIIAVAVNLPKNTGEPLPQTSAAVASAEPTMPPEPSLTAQPSEQPSADFTLTQQQATELLTDVAAPLLLTEWNAVMDYSDTYNPEDWQNLPHMDISDFDDMLTHGEVDVNNPYWEEFAFVLQNVDEYTYDKNNNSGYIFGDVKQKTQDANGTPHYIVPLSDYKQYYKDAFNIDLPNELNRAKTEFSLGITDDGNFEVPLGDPYADIAITELPKSSVKVRDGKVTFTGNLCGMFVWDQSWDTMGIESIPWTITLDVIENPDSRFGCNVTGYQASAVVNTNAAETSAQTLQNLDGVWTATPDYPEDSVSYLIEGNRVTMTSFYGKQLEGITSTGEFNSDGSLNVTLEYKGEIDNLTFSLVDTDTLFVINEIEGYGIEDAYYYRISSSKTELNTLTTFDVNGLLFPDSNTRYLTAEELASLDKEMLGFARNEIFARHGNIFQTPKYADHYSQFPWYKNLPKKADVGYPDLNEYEIANVELIKQFEENGSGAASPVSVLGKWGLQSVDLLGQTLTADELAAANPDLANTAVEFREDGKYSLASGGDTDYGTYEIAGNTLKIVENGITMTGEVYGNILTLDLSPVADTDFIATFAKK